MSSTNFVSGLSSGLDWASIIDQLMKVERKPIENLEGEKALNGDKLDVWQEISTRLLSVLTQSKGLKSADTFNVYTVTATSSSSTNPDQLLMATTSSTAVPGTHTIEMTASSTIAQARKLSSKSFSQKDEALGISGDILINSRKISIETGDSLEDVRDKINNVNIGDNASGVTASLIKVSSTDYRLILTSSETGRDAFNIQAASSTDLLESLGLSKNGNDTIKHKTSDGATSDLFTGSDTAVGSLLGITTAASGTVTIAGQDISLDLNTQSLTQIASAINAISGVTSSVETVTEDGVTKYRIDISGTTDIEDNDTNVLETLGIVMAGQTSEQEIHRGSVSNKTGGSNIISGTYWKDFDSTLSDGDTITFTGTNHVGTTVSGTYTIDTNTANGGNGETVQELLTAIENAFAAVDSGAYTVSASVVDGKIQITDDTSGDSQISLNVVTNNEGGGNLDFGEMSAITEGYDMEMVAGQDAKIVVDGVMVSRSSNTFDDVIEGVTLDLKKIEQGTTITLRVERDIDTIQSTIEDFVASYNEVITYMKEQSYYDQETEEKGILLGDNTLSLVRSDIRNIMIDTVSGLESSINALSLIGITTDEDGLLTIDGSELKNKLLTNFDEAKNVFIGRGMTTDSDVVYIGHTNDTKAGTYDINITTAAEQATITGSVDLLSGIGAGNTETITITDTNTGRVAKITLDGNAGENGSSIDNIVNAVNSELSAQYTETLVGEQAVLSGGSAITSATVWDAIDGETLSDGDTFSFSGTNRNGVAVSGSYTITDKTTDTVQGLLSAIEGAYDNEVSATVDSSGRIVITDSSAGDSLLTFYITEPATGGVNFGDVDIDPAGSDGSKEGRYAMDITASKNASNHLVITHDYYGSNEGFTVNVSGSLLGFTDGQSDTGVDVAGTINGEAATGTGQLLKGDAPAEGGETSVEGLSLLVTLSSSELTSQGSSQGQVKLTFGVAEQMYRELDFIINDENGYLNAKEESLQNTINSIEDKINVLEDRLSAERERLTNQFVAMERAVSQMNNISSWLSSQLNSINTFWA